MTEEGSKAGARHAGQFCMALLIACCCVFPAREARSELQAGNALNVCSHAWPDAATGWRTHAWQRWSCSNELPVAGAAFVGQAQNGGGTSGQSSCGLTQGSHYNHPTYDTATSGAVRCLFVPPASSTVQPNPAMTVCRYTFTGYATGWRTRLWEAPDCSHGLPAINSWAIGQAENGNGTEGMPSCSTTQGGHYNHPTWNGATSGTIRCAFLNGAPVSAPETTLCRYTWTSYANGWRTRTWSAADCSHGLPAANAVAVGSSENGSGAGSAASCGATTGSHYNHPTQTGATTGTIHCLYAKRPAPPAGTYEFDLNADGANDANVSFESCNDGSGRQCLVVNSWFFAAQRTIPIEGTTTLPVSSSPATVNYKDPIRLIGDHTGDGLAEIAVLYVRALPDSKYAPAMAVADVNVQSILGSATSPPALSNFDFDYLLSADVLYPAGPGARVYPAFTPGYGDTNNVDARRWGWGCLFRVGASSTECGANFLRVDTQPQTPLPYNTTVWFREAFGHVHDIDGDGWEDLQLPYHWALLSVSGKTAGQLTTTSYDVAAATGAQPVQFHSGRNCGTHRTAPVGPVNRTVLVAGSPVGDWDNPICNVSRFTALLGQSGSPSTRALVWTRFDGFHSNNWTAWPWVAPGGQAPTPSRWGDFADKCIHRYSDSRTVMDGQEVLLVNYFAADWTHPDNAPLVTRCKDEQYQLYMAPVWTPAKQDVWNACAARHADTRGRWGMKVIRESDGAVLTGGQETYVCGWSAALNPGSEVLYLVETFPNPVRFNLKADAGSRLAPQQLRVLALVNGLWSDRGLFPVAGRPVLLDAPKAGSVGTGDSYAVKALNLVDRDSDGLKEVAIQTSGGTTIWIGWSPGSNSWAVKP